MTKLKEVRKTGTEEDAIRFEGKSNDEIRSMIREDLNIPDLKDEMIEILREDGKVIVKVNRENKKRNVKIETEDEIK